MARMLLFILILPTSVFSQLKLDLTVFGGFSNYYGELQEKRFTLDQGHKAFGAGLSLAIRDKLSVHGTLKKGQLSADDRLSNKPGNKARNLSFGTNIYEAALTLDYSIFDLHYKNWSPYVFGGLAAFHFNPYAAGSALQPLSTEGQGFIEGRKKYMLNTIGVPFGAGIRVRISKNTFLGYEIGLRKTFTDYLDDVSRTYVDQTLLLQNRGQRAVDLAFRGDELNHDLPYPAGGTLRGSPGSNDWYYYSGITLSFRITNEDGKLFGKNIGKGSTECPRRVL
jgi:hypothetical protein